MQRQEQPHYAAPACAGFSGRFGRWLMEAKAALVWTVLLAVSAAGIGGVKADTIALNLVYLGSTTGNAIKPTWVAQNSGPGVPLPSLVSSTNVSTSGTADGVFNASGLNTNGFVGTQLLPNVKNYFGVYAQYNPGTNAHALYGIGFDVIMSTGLVPVSSTNLQDLTTQKWLSFNPADVNTGTATWLENGDIGALPGDLAAIAYYQVNPAYAFQENLCTPSADGTVASGADGAGYISGEGTLLGIFAVQLTSSYPGFGHITLRYGGTGAFQYFTSPTATTAIINDNGFTGATYFVQGYPTPEPASAGIVALGLFALGIRRRKVGQGACA